MHTHKAITNSKHIMIHAAVLGILLAVGSLSGADTLYLRAGEQEPGHLVSMTRDTVTFEGQDGIKILPKSEVLKIQLQRARMHDDVQTVDQITDPELKKWVEQQPSLEQLPSAGSAMLLHRRTFDLTKAGEFTETLRTITKVLRQRGEGAGTRAVSYFEDLDEPRVDYALTVTADGRVLHLDDAAFKNESIYASLPDYRRLSRVRFACKEPRPGSLLDVQTSVKRGLREFVRPFYAENLFRGSNPIFSKEVVVLITEDRENELAYELYGPDVVAMSREVTGGVVRLTWRLQQPQPGIIGETLMPPLEDFVPVLTIGTKTSWEAIGKFYVGAMPIGSPMEKSVSDKALELHAQGGAQAIYHFVTRDIDGVGVPQRSFRMTPSPPAETLRRGLGNGLDKNFLCYALLKAAGVDCSFALVHTRGEGKLAQTVPSLRAFNRSAIYLAKEDTFLYCANKLLPFGTLPGALHGAPVIIFEEDGVRLAATTRPEPVDEIDHTLFEARLDAQGHLDLTVTFDGQQNAGTWIRSLKDLDEQQLKIQFQQIAAYLHPAAVLKHYSTTDLEDLAIPPAATLECNIPEYAVKAGDELMLLNLPAVSYSASDVGKPVREHGLYWNHVSRQVTKGTLHLPEGYAVYALPEPTNFDSPTVSYVAKLKCESGTIVFADAYDLKVHSAPAEAYGDYKACKELRARLPLQRIILTRK